MQASQYLQFLTQRKIGLERHRQSVVETYQAVTGAIQEVDYLLKEFVQLEAASNTNNEGNSEQPTEGGTE